MAFSTASLSETPSRGTQQALPWPTEQLRDAPTPALLDAQDPSPLHEAEMMKDGAPRDPESGGNVPNRELWLLLQQSKNAHSREVAESLPNEGDQFVVHADTYRRWAQKWISDESSEIGDG